MIRALSLALALALLPAAAGAHSALEASVPADGATVAAPVDVLEMRFRAPIRLTRIEIEGPDGAERVEPADPSGQDFAIPVELPPGAYVLRWIGLGADGHPMKGTVGFAVE